MTLVDTHCHIDLYTDYQQVINSVESKKIYTIAVTTAPSVYRQSSALTKGQKFLRTALGLHPELVSQKHQEIDLFKHLMADTKYIGEIGLDYVTQNDESYVLQRKVFKIILDCCATAKDKILTVHSRRAAADVVDMIGNHYPGKVILHWFSGGKKVLLRGLEYGFYFSINSAMLQSASGLRLIHDIPLDRLLTESDGPFINIKGRPANPLDMDYVVQRLSEVKQIDREDIETRIFSNFRGLLTTSDINPQLGAK